MNIIAVNFSADTTGAWEAVVASILRGAQAAGAQAQRCQCGEDRDAVTLLERISNADHAVLGTSGDIDVFGSVYSQFVESCVACSAAPDRASRSLCRAVSSLSAHPRVVSTRRRAIIVVAQPPSAMQRFDPCANEFLILDETARWLGFTPLGHILCTAGSLVSGDLIPADGDGAFEVGRRLVLGGADVA
jgi:hypothetical protein